MRGAGKMVGATIRAVQIDAEGQLSVRQQPAAAIEPGQVRLAVAAVGICGSDVALARAEHPYAAYPVVPGHEIGAYVVEDPLGEFQAGTLVSVRPSIPCGHCPTCRAGRPNRCPSVQVLGVHLDGGFSEQLAVASEQLVPLPTAAGADAAALVEPTAVALHMVRRSEMAAGETIAVIGAGVIGSLALLVAKRVGADVGVGIDRLPNRLALNRQLGADLVIDNRKEDATSAARQLVPAGFDAVLDLVGTAETLGLAARLGRPGARIVVGALPHAPLPLDLEPYYRKELSLRTSRLYHTEFREAAEWIGRAELDPRPLVTHHFPLSQAGRAIHLAAEQPENAIKVLIHPGEDASPPTEEN